jgi:serine/threonine-protein kinase
LSEEFPVQLAGFQPGSLLAGYELEAPVGAGGMAVVFRARDQRLGRLVALKILAPALSGDSAYRRRFIAESRAAAAVDDPHIVPVYEAGEAGGVLFIAMRLVLGGDLRRVLDREGVLAPGRAVEFISPVASALDAAHRAGLVHRDVKPANILVDARSNRPDHVYLSDFGVSKGAVSSVSLTGAGQFLGTPDYSAPEQIQGLAVDGRTDQYALACVAYQLLTGAVPFERDQGMAVLLAHLSEPPPSLGTRRLGLPSAVDQVLARGMAKAPEDRYGSCVDFADALREALGLAPYYPPGAASAPDRPRTEIVSPTPESPRPSAASPAVEAAPTVTGTAPRLPHSAVGQTSRRRPVIIAVVAAVIAVIGLVTALTALPGSPGTPSARATPSTSATPSVPTTSVRWSYTAENLVSSLTVAGGAVYIGSGADVYALDAATGQRRWSYTTAGVVDTSPVLADGIVYVGSADGGGVYALDAATGRLRWFYSQSGAYDNSPAVAGGTVYVDSGGNVYALDAATGQLRWSYTTGGAGNSLAVAVGTVYAGSGGDVYALDAATGRLRWSYPAAGGVDSGPAVDGSTVYLGSTGGSVDALDAATGRLRWSYPARGGVDSGPAVADGTVYVGSTAGKVYALNAGL